MPLNPLTFMPIILPRPAATSTADLLWPAGRLSLLLFFLAFFAYPLALVFINALQTPTGIAHAFLQNSSLFVNSMLIACLSTLGAFLIGFPAGYLVARKEFFGRRFLKHVALVPFVFPSILVVLSFIIVFGNNGWLNSMLRAFGFQPLYHLYSLYGIAFAHTFYNFPIVMLFTSNALESLDRHMHDAARSLGARKQKIFLAITMPQVLPQLVSSLLLVFIYSFTSFALVLSFGGIMYSNMEAEIFRLVSRNADLPASAALALVQFAFLLMLSIPFLALMKKNAVKRQFFVHERRKIGFSMVGIVQHLFALATLSFILIPLLALVYFAFFDSGAFSLRAFEKIANYPNSLVGTTPLLSVFYSLLLASIASLLSTIFALLASLKKTGIGAVSFLLGSSIAVSVITLSFGYYLGFGPENLLVIAAAHSVIAFPFCYRIISSSLASIDAESLDAARSLGASELRALGEVIIPRIRGSIVSSIAFSFAVSLGELGVVLVLYNGVYATMPVYIYRLISTFDVRAAAAMGLVLVVMSSVCFYLVQREREVVLT